MKPINNDNIDAIQAARHRREQLANSLAILDEKTFWLCDYPYESMGRMLSENPKPSRICFGDSRQESGVHPDATALQVLSEKLDQEFRTAMRQHIQSMIRQLDETLATFGMVIK